MKHPLYRASDLEEQMKAWFPTAIVSMKSDSNRKQSQILDAFSITMFKIGDSIVSPNNVK